MITYGVPGTFVMITYGVSGTLSPELGSDVRVGPSNPQFPSVMPAAAAALGSIWRRASTAHTPSVLDFECLMRAGTAARAAAPIQSQGRRAKVSCFGVRVLQCGDQIGHDPLAHATEGLSGQNADLDVGGPQRRHESGDEPFSRRGNTVDDKCDPLKSPLFVPRRLKRAGRASLPIRGRMFAACFANSTSAPWSASTRVGIATRAAGPGMGALTNWISSNVSAARRRTLASLSRSRTTRAVVAGPPMRTGPMQTPCGRRRRRLAARPPGQARRPSRPGRAAPGHEWRRSETCRSQRSRQQHRHPLVGLGVGDASDGKGSGNPRLRILVLQSR